MSTENASRPSESFGTTTFPRRVDGLLVLTSALISALAVCALAVPVHGQSVASSIPEYAQPKRYGQGWECKPGYRSAGETCDEILVPENAYATDGALGKGWKCMHGFVGKDEACVPVVVPANAYLISSGDGWRCQRMYRRIDDGCEAISPPANGFFVSGGSSSQLKCDWGFTNYSSYLSSNYNRVAFIIIIVISLN